MLRFTFFSGDTNWQDYGGIFLSKKLNNGPYDEGGFDYWLAIRVTNMEDACGSDATYTYNVELLSVSPSEAVKELPAAYRCCGFDPDKNHPLAVQLDALLSYGVYTVLDSLNGNNLRALMRQIHKEADASQCFYGFMMDRPVNAIGTLGWQAQRGELWPVGENKLLVPSQRKERE